MKLHWTKICALVAAALLGVYAFATPESGFWDSTFFPITYLVLAGSILVAAWRPSRRSLRIAAAVGMTKGILRSLTFLFAEQNYAGAAFHALFALMVYTIWRCFREGIPVDGTKELIQAIHDTEVENTEQRAAVVAEALEQRKIGLA
jgi:hypothetical protein